MSQGGPLSEPLSGLVVYVCIPGAAPGTTLAEPTTTLCRASGEERALGKLHYAAAANSPVSSAPPLWEKLAPNSAARVRAILATALPLVSARWLRTEASWVVNDDSAENPFCCGAILGCDWI